MVSVANEIMLAFNASDMLPRMEQLPGEWERSRKQEHWTVWTVWSNKKLRLMTIMSTLTLLRLY